MLSFASAAARLVLVAAAFTLPVLAQADGAPSFAPKKTRPFSDNFAKDKSLNTRWTLAEPNSASSYKLGGSGLLLDASAQNGGSDLWPFTNYNASLLLQPVTPSLNWTITTKIKFQVTNNYMGAGLVLTTQTNGFNSGSSFHRFEYGDNPQPGIESFTNGSPDPNYVPFDAKLVYLQLQKSGSTYIYSYSTDGKTWTQVSTVTDTTQFTYIGLISIRQPYDDDFSVDSKPVFRYFKVKVAKG
jgi:regulation of enolase protein 1 (concanavalin A-like superfamily)